MKKEDEYNEVEKNRKATKDTEEYKSATASEEAEDQEDLSPTWAQDARQDLDDWIEEQGVYLRQ
ncbi:MAG: hypothetical protein ACK5MN_08455 [Lachnospiraceae bacterium]